MGDLFIRKASVDSNWKDTTLVFLTLIYSGNLALGRIFSIEFQYAVLAIVFGFMLLNRTRRFSTPAFMYIALIYLSILLIQCISFSFYPFVTIAGFFTRLFIGYAMMRLVKNFPKVYVKVMVGLAILSFVFYFSYLLFYYSGINLDSKIIQIATSLGTASSGSGYRYPLIFHTFVLFENSFFRNSGMFWEPGAFQGYLILALIFLAFVKNDMPRKQYIRYLLILCSAVLSTLSTTGYIALALIPLLHYNWQARQRSRMMFRLAVGLVIILPLLVVGGLYAYRTLPFLGEKIEGQMEQAQYQNRAGWYKGRVGSLVFDWKYIQERPLTGWGLHSVTRHALDPWMQVDDGMGNGMSDFTAKFGITGMLLWLFFVFRGMMYHTERNLQVSLVAVLIICLVLQGEAFLGFPLFLGLAFMGPFKKLYISRHFLTRKTLVKRLAESY